MAKKKKEEKREKGFGERKVERFSGPRVAFIVRGLLLIAVEGARTQLAGTVGPTISFSFVLLHFILFFCFFF